MGKEWAGLFFTQGKNGLAHSFSGEKTDGGKFRPVTPGRRQSKMLILSTNVDKKLLETEFSIAICRRTGNKWQLKTLLLVIFDPSLSIVKSILDSCRPGVI